MFNLLLWTETAGRDEPFGGPRGGNVLHAASGRLRRGPADRPCSLVRV